MFNWSGFLKGLRVRAGGTGGAGVPDPGSKQGISDQAASGNLTSFLKTEEEQDVSPDQGSRPWYRGPWLLVPCLGIGGCVFVGFLLLRDDGGSSAPPVTISGIPLGTFTETISPPDEMVASTVPAVATTPKPSTGTSTATTVGGQSVAPTVVVQKVSPTTIPVAAPPIETRPPVSSPTTDPRFKSCDEVIANKLGPYFKEKDPEYEWYPDDNSDGIVCDAPRR